MVGYIVIASLVIMLASLSGKLVTWGVLGTFIRENLRFMTSFALGVFLVTFGLMVTETVHLEVGLGMTFLFAGIGALVLEGVQRLVPGGHHHHGANTEDCADDDVHEHDINPRRVLMSDAAHNFGDGILLASAFLIDFHVGVAAALGILLHEIVQEVSEFFILKEAGYSTTRALTSNFIVSFTVLMGAVFALFVAQAEEYVPYLIAFAAGATLYIILMDLIPHVLSSAKRHADASKHLAMALLGGALLFGVVQIVPHEHEHGDTHEEISHGEHM